MVLATEMPGAASLDMRVPPQAHVSCVVREAVAEFARSHQIEDDDLTYFLAALGEALANAIEHAHADTSIEVSVWIGSDRIGATVRDHGVGFDVDTRREPALPDPHAERGRGLPIMRRCCDLFSIESAPGAGTIVRIGRSFGALTAAL